MRSKLLAMLFSMVLLLMAFSAAAADHLTIPETDVSTADYWSFIKDQFYSQLGASLPSRLSISGGEFGVYQYGDQLTSQEGASLNSQLTISGDEDWAYQQ